MTKLRKLTIAGKLYKFMTDKLNGNLYLSDLDTKLFNTIPFNVNLEDVDEEKLNSIIKELIMYIINSCNNSIMNVYNDLVFTYYIQDSEINEILTY